MKTSINKARLAIRRGRSLAKSHTDFGSIVYAQIVRREGALLKEEERKLRFKIEARKLYDQLMAGARAEQRVPLDFKRCN